MEELLRAGVDLFRLNFSARQPRRTRRPHRWPRARPKRRPAAGRSRILADLQGPEAPRRRPAQRPDRGAHVVRAPPAPPRRPRTIPDTIPIPHPELVASLQLGDRLLIDDGKMMLHIVKVEGADRIARPVAPGRIMSRKGIAVPNRPIPIPALTEKDIADGKFALAQGVDYIALSFVQRAADLTLARRDLRRARAARSRRSRSPPRSTSSTPSSRSRTP
jgi:pyruvate kinase